jgi:hypothetical protein
MIKLEVLSIFEKCISETVYAGRLRGSNPEIFLFSKTSRPALRPT